VKMVAGVGTPEATLATMRSQPRVPRHPDAASLAVRGE
jgi:hypothetical protein